MVLTFHWVLWSSLLILFLLSCMSWYMNFLTRASLATPVSHHFPSLEPRSSGQPPGIFCHKQTDLKGLKWISICMFNIGLNRYPGCSENSPPQLHPCPLGGQPSSPASFSLTAPPRSWFSSPIGPKWLTHCLTVIIYPVKATVLSALPDSFQKCIECLRLF